MVVHQKPWQAVARPAHAAAGMRKSPAVPGLAIAAYSHTRTLPVPSLVPYDTAWVSVEIVVKLQPQSQSQLHHYLPAVYG